MARGNFKRGGRGGGGSGGGGRGRGRGRGGRGGRGRGGGGGGHRNFYDNRKSFDEVRKENEKMERLYNMLNIVPEGAEREAFWAALRKELPNSFRFTGSKGHALSVRDNLVTRYFPLIEGAIHDNQPVKLPTQLPWYPNGLAYRMDTPKHIIRKYEPFKEFQKFLVSETGVGNISRQEEVSMIPPMLLDVEPHHTVLDLCAAPGSKSAQLIELIHAGEEDRVERAIRLAKGEEPGSNVEMDLDSMGDEGRATGMLVANDVNYQRAQMLVHQVKRLNSPNLVVTNHDATMFPSIELPPIILPGKQKRGKYLKFDRILADVPCSGDGTCRKNPNIWKDWTPQNGLGLYQTQVRILTRALQMLQVGGRVVYSTCSMNPVENEAVIAAAIERCGGTTKVKLLDCSERLPGLIRSQGLTDWSIMSRNGQIYESWPEAEQFEGSDSRIVPGMFAPEPEEQISLQHCWRVYPHQQDTGGFFIAALEKLSEIKAKPENESKSGNKNWKFVPVDDPNPTAFTALVDELANEGEPSGEVPMAVSENMSSGQRQNTTGTNTSSNGAKRQAPDPEDTSSQAKKARIAAGNESGAKLTPTDISTSNGALENGANGSTVDEVEDAKANAPFEKTVPSDAAQLPKRRKDDPIGEEAFKYLPADHAELASIYDFYELHPSFPRDRFLVRNPAGDPVKGIYYSSQLIKDILVQNEGRGMKFVHAGVKMFMKQDAQGQNICRWRIQTEGLSIIEGWVGESRVVHLRKKSTLRKLLVEMFPKIPTTKHEDGTETGGWKDLGEVGEPIKDIGMGCCVLRVEASHNGANDEFNEPLTLPLWRSMHSVNLMLPKEDRKAMLLRIYNEDVELINHSDSKQKSADENSEKDHPEPTAGSVPAESDAIQLQEKFKQDDEDANNDEAVMDVDAVTGLPVSAEGALALEQDAVSTRDRIESQRLEVLESEARKVAEAMPERAGEGDDYNTTV